MKFRLLCAVTAAALVALPSAVQAQSGSTLRSDPGLRGPSTGTSSDAAGTAGTTAPRSGSAPPSTSVGISGANQPTAPTESSRLCDTLIGEERARCLREQAAGTRGSAGAGSTGMGSAGGASPGAGGGATPGMGGGRR